ncbi:hypothetical protein LTR95_001672 [Oleoguttula sp. CCFEE 5521]
MGVETLQGKADADSGNELTYNGAPSRSRLSRSWRAFRGFIWDDPDKPKAERWFLFKLDCFFLTIAMLGYFSKNLDQSNVNNAYVSGMKEALGMYGSELTYAGNCFTAGYLIGQLPAVMLVTRVRPSLLIPTVELLWTVTTFSASAIKTPGQLYAIRFLVGLFESAYFPCVIYMLGSWYTKEERGKRLTIFYSTTAMSQMFSGYLQAAAYKNLSGVGGREGWSWLFIICGVICLPIGLAGYFCFPDFPETTRAFYLTEAEVHLARSRLAREGLKPLGASPWNRKKIARIAGHWQFWLLPLGYFFIQGSLPSYQPVFALWLKSTKHPVYEINVWPTGQLAVGLVVQILAGMISDSRLLQGKRWQMILIMQAGTFFGAVSLAAWNISYAHKLAAYYFLYFSAGVPGVWYAWYVDLIPHDHEMRGAIIALSNMFSFLQSIWFTIAVWRTVEAPRFRAGFIFAATLGVAIVSLSLIIRVLQSRDEKKRAQEDGVINDSSDVSVEGAKSGKIADGAVTNVYKGESVAASYA